ncbi:MAG: methyltransferase domain-containing protein [Deltaproteobacteria bacterium]|nr:methyltransferase domain-containing protein [Deltaproteobacteria bacterium]
MQYYVGSKPWGDVLPRYAFFEFLFAGKRVLEIGCGDGAGAHFLKDRGAASVVSLAVNGEESANDEALVVKPGVEFQHYDGLRLAFDDASFDLVVDFGLSYVQGGQRLIEIARVLGPHGLLLSAVSNPKHYPMGSLCGRPRPGKSPTFERFVANLQERFGSVSVFGQSPFLGFSIGWMGAEDQDLPLEMDTGLLSEDTEDVAYYVVIAGQEAVSVESQALVQLPYAELSQEWEASMRHMEESLAREDVSAPKEDSNRLQAELQLAEVKAVDRERFLHDARTRLQEVELELERVREQSIKYERGLNAAKTQLDRKDQDVEGLKKRLGEFDREFQVSRNQVHDREKLISKSQGKLDDLLAENGDLGRRVAQSDAQLEALRRQLLDVEQVNSSLRVEFQQRRQDEIGVSKDLLCLLLGLDEEHPLKAGDVPLLFRSAVHDREELQSEIARLHSGHDELSGAAEMAEERSLGLEAELASSRSAGDAMRQELQHLRDEREEKASWLQAARDEVQRLNEALGAEAKRVSSFEKELARQAKLQKEHAKRRPDAETLMAAARKENRELKARLDEADRDLDDMRQGRLAEEGQLVGLRAEDEQRRILQVQTDRRIERLLREVDDAQGQIQLLEQENAQSRDGHRGLRVEMDGLEDRLRRQQLVVEDSNRFHQAEQEKRKELQRRMPVLEGELEDIQQEALQLRGHLTGEAERYSVLQKKYSEQIERSQELEADLLEVVNRLQEDQAKEHDQQRLLHSLKDRQEQHVLHQKDAQEKIDELTRELFVARRNEEDLAAAIELLRSALVEQEQEREQMLSQLDNLRLGEDEDQRVALQAIAQAEGDVLMLRRRLEEQSADAKRMRDAFERTHARAARQRRELDKAEARLAEVLDRLSDAESFSGRIEGMERDLAWHRKELEQRKEASADLQAENETLKVEQERNLDELDHMQAQFHEASAEVAGLVMERDRLTLEIGQIKSRQEDELGHAMDRKAQVEELERLLREEKSRIDAYEKQKTEREADLEQARGLVEQERGQVRKLEEECELLHKQEEQTRLPLQEALELASERERTLQSRLANLQEQMAEHREQTEIELGSLGDQIRRRDEKMHDLTSRLAQTEELRHEFEAREDEIRQALAGERVRSAEGQAQLDAHSARVVELEEQAQNASGNGAEQEQVRQAAAAREHELLQQLAQNQEALTTSYAEIRNVRDQADLTAKQLRQLLEEREQRLRSLERDLAAQSEELAKLKAVAQGEPVPGDS